MSRESTLAGDLLREFRTRFGDSDGLQVALAPGRVNLIGEHTDYNDGWALPMAIDRHIGIAFRPSGNRRIRVHSLEFNETREIDLDALTPLSDQPWPAYVAGVAWAMGEAGHELSGMEGVIGGNLPIGAGVSSSAALEMAVARALCEASKIPWVPEEMARLGRKADNDYIGIGSGPLDQLASAASQEGCALLLDCRTLETRAIHLPSNVRVVAMDTGVRRALAESEYNDRLASCQRAVEALRHIDSSINALRDADIGLLVAARDQLDDTSFQRARHVIEENERPVAMASALSAGRLAEAGSLMNDSHTSLRKLYEVSSPELDLITDLARDHAACFGARLTGAGFGGCAIALVASDGVTDFVSKVHRAYSEQIDLPSAFFDCRPAAGAKLRDAGDGRTVTTTENDRE